MILTSVLTKEILNIYMEWLITLFNCMRRIDFSANVDVTPALDTAAKILSGRRNILFLNEEIRVFPIMRNGLRLVGVEFYAIIEAANGIRRFWVYRN